MCPKFSATFSAEEPNATFSVCFLASIKINFVFVSEEKDKLVCYYNLEKLKTNFDMVDLIEVNLESAKTYQMCYAFHGCKAVHAIVMNIRPVKNFRCTFSSVWILYPTCSFDVGFMVRGDLDQDWKLAAWAVMVCIELIGIEEQS